MPDPTHTVEITVPNAITVARCRRRLNPDHHHGRPGVRPAFARAFDDQRAIQHRLEEPTHIRTHPDSVRASNRMSGMAQQSELEAVEMVRDALTGAIGALKTGAPVSFTP